MKILKHAVLIMAFVLLPVWGAVPALAGHWQAEWAGYDWGGTYPGWAAEGFEPSN